MCHREKRPNVVHRFVLPRVRAVPAALAVVFSGMLMSASSVAATTCDVTFELANSVTIGALQFDVDYSAAGGSFVGVGDRVECADLTDSISSFRDKDALEILTAGFISLDGIRGPAPLARCAFESVSGSPSTGAFAISIVDATDPLLNPANAVVRIAQILCGGCGDASGDGRITATDALVTLQAAVGAAQCARAICDANGDGRISASDALLILQAAVGIPVTFRCDGSPSATTTTTSSTSSTTSSTTSTTTSTSSTTTTTVSLCPTNGPITDLRNDCSHLGYFYVLGSFDEVLTTTGDTVIGALNDGIDVLGYFGPVTGRRTFILTHARLNGSDFFLLDPGSGGNISTDGRRLNLTIIVAGRRLDLPGALWVKTAPLLTAELGERARAMAKSNPALHAGAPVGSASIGSVEEAFAGIRERIAHER